MGGRLELGCSLLGDGDLGEFAPRPPDLWDHEGRLRAIPVGESQSVPWDLGCFLLGRWLRLEVPLTAPAKGFIRFSIARQHHDCCRSGFRHASPKEGSVR